MRGDFMANKVQKRRVRREREAEQLGLNAEVKKTKDETLEEQKKELQKWFWFFVTCGLLWFIYTFGGQG